MMLTTLRTRRDSAYLVVWLLIMVQPSLQLDIGKNSAAVHQLITITILLFSENCNAELGAESEAGSSSEVVISASSSYDPLNVGPQHARWVEYIQCAHWPRYTKNLSN